MERDVEHLTYPFFRAFDDRDWDALPMVTAEDRYFHSYGMYRFVTVRADAGFRIAAIMQT